MSFCNSSRLCVLVMSTHDTSFAFIFKFTQPSPSLTQLWGAQCRFKAVWMISVLESGQNLTGRSEGWNGYKCDCRLNLKNHLSALMCQIITCLFHATQFSSGTSLHRNVKERHVTVMYCSTNIYYTAVMQNWNMFWILPWTFATMWCAQSVCMTFFVIQLPYKISCSDRQACIKIYFPAFKPSIFNETERCKVYLSLVLYIEFPVSSFERVDSFTKSGMIIISMANIRLPPF